MSVSKHKIARHIADYNAVTGESRKKFVCPITLRECEDEELINGHILCEGIIGAPRRTVIQYARVDNHFGTTVEPTLIRYLNLPRRTSQELIEGGHEFTVKFQDGTEETAFFGGKHAHTRFPAVNISVDGKFLGTAFVKIAKDDPRAQGQPVEISRTDRFRPSNWIAAMVKSGYLALFEMVGYQAVFCPWGDTVRRDLKKFYEEKGGREDAGRYFYAYRNAVKIFGAESMKDWLATSNTILDRTILLHYTPQETMFAATCLFPIGNVTFAVTLPQSVAGQDVAIAVSYYERLMEEQAFVPQFVARAKFEGTFWKVESTKRRVHYPPELTAAVKELFERPQEKASGRERGRSGRS